MEIEHVKHEVIEVNFEKRGNQTHGVYVFCNATIGHTFKIDGKEYTTYWQNGHYFNYGDYDCPSNDFEIYDVAEENAFIVEAYEESDSDLYEFLTSFRPRIDDHGWSDDPKDYDHLVVKYELDEDGHPVDANHVWVAYEDLVCGQVSEKLRPVE